MPIQTNCPGCQKPLQLPDDAAGKKVQCPACKQIFAAAQPEPAAAPEVAEAAPPSTAISEAAPAMPSRTATTKAGPPRIKDDDRERRERSRRPPASSGGFAVILIVVGFLAIGLLAVPCVGIVGLWFLWRVEPVADKPAKPMVAKDADGPIVMEGPIKKVEPDMVPFDPREDTPVAKNPDPPPVKPFLLPPLPEAIEIKPAPIAKETPYKLPGPIGALRVGGGGRFLVLHFPATRNFGIFDASTAKIERYIKAPEDDVAFAAGMTQLVVFAPGSKVIQRYNLMTGEREQLGKLDVPDGKVEAFCMGHASAGPLLVGVARSNPRLYDIAEFEEILLPANPQNKFGNNGPMRLDGGNYWAGTTGRVLGHTGNYGMPNGVKTIVFTGGKIEKFGEHVGTWFVVPGPDDRHIYAGGHGVLSERVKPVSNVAFSKVDGSGFASHLYLPAHHGPFYLHAQTIDGSGSKTDPPNGTIRLFMLGDKEPIATYANTAVCRYGWEALKGLGIEHSIHLIPKAKLLVVVPASRDELRLYPADLEHALDKTGRDFLIFTSTPPASFQKGNALT